MKNSGSILVARYPHISFGHGSEYVAALFFSHLVHPCRWGDEAKVVPTNQGKMNIL